LKLLHGSLEFVAPNRPRLLRNPVPILMGLQSLDFDVGVSIDA
jgi:hypothetical protein